MNRRLITNIVEGKYSSIDISEIPTKKTFGANKDVECIDWSNGIGKIIIYTFDRVSYNIRIDGYDAKKCVLTLNVVDEGFRDDLDYRVASSTVKKCGLTKLIRNIYANKKYDFLHKYMDEDTLRNSSVGLKKKVKCKCPDCGYEKEMIIRNIIKQGFGCHICGDGISYPEKVLANILFECGIMFEKQISFDGGITRYDFYVPSHNLIIETHGKQHYRQQHRKGARTLKEEQLNDKYKRLLAHMWGCNYIAIDCRNSNIHWIVDNIKKSSLKEILNIDDVDIRKIEENSRSSIVKQVCNKFNDGYKIQELMGMFNIKRLALTNYLKIGTELGFCKYDPELSSKETIRLNAEKNRKRVVGINVRTFDMVEFKSVSECERTLGVNSVSECCNRKKKYCGDYIFRYEDDETLDYLEVAEEVRRKFNTCVIGRHLIDGHEVLYKNAMEASADLGVDFRQIYSCLNNKVKSAYGYVWEYITISDNKEALKELQSK